jgi:hypothetical protein
MELVAAHHNDIPHIFQLFSFQELGRWAQIEFSSIEQCFSAACTFQTCVNVKPLLKARPGGVTYHCEPGLLVQKLPHENAIA